MLRGLVTCLLLAITSQGFSQTPVIDSLKAVLATTPDDTSKVNTLNELTQQYRERDNFTAFKFGVEAVTLSERLNYNEGLAIALENVGWVNYRKGAYLEAFELSARALQLNEKLNKQKAIARCLNNLSAISYERKQFAEAISGFKRAFQISTAQDDVQTAVRSLNNISFTFLALKQLDSARNYAQEAVLLSNSKDDYLPSFSLRLLGDIALEENNISEALDLFNQCIANSDRTQNYFVKTSTLHRIGKAYSMLGQHTKALEILNENISIAQRFGYLDELERTYKLISDIYDKNGQNGLALKNLRLYLELHDSLNNQRNNERTALMQAKFESEIKQSRIELLTKDTQLKSEEIDKQLAWKYFYFGCSLLTIVLLAVLYRTNGRFRRINKELEKKNQEISDHTRKLQGMSVTKDKLLSIVSHDLRSPLNGFKGLLGLFRKDQVNVEEMKRFTHKLDQRLTVLTDDLDNLLQWTQSQLHELRVNKASVNLESSLRNIVELFQDQIQDKEIKIEQFISSTDNVLVDANHFKIIIRNILGNAIKFTGHGGSIRLDSVQKNDEIILKISDSGIGMSQSEIDKLFNPTFHFTKAGTENEKGLGVGLLLTKEFLDKNDVGISVTSELNNGTTFILVFQRA